MRTTIIAKMQSLKFLTSTQRLRSINLPIRPACFPVIRNYKVKANFGQICCVKPSFSISHTLCSVSVQSSQITSFNRRLSNTPVKDERYDDQDNEEPPKKLSLYQRYKKMFKEYWYVLLPVHCVTSAVWFGGFYFASTCGLDIMPFLDYINVPESWSAPLRNSSLGHLALALALYKLASPVRYLVTVGGSTFAVNILKKRGLIKPVPTKAEIKTMIKNKLKKEEN